MQENAEWLRASSYVSAVLCLLLLRRLQCLQDKLFKDVAEGSRSRPVILGGALQVIRSVAVGSEQKGRPTGCLVWAVSIVQRPERAAGLAQHLLWHSRWCLV